MIVHILRALPGTKVDSDCILTEKKLRKNISLEGRELPTTSWKEAPTELCCKLLHAVWPLTRTGNPQHSLWREALSSLRPQESSASSFHGRTTPSPPRHSSSAPVSALLYRREQEPQGWGTNQSVRVAASEKHTLQHLRAAAQDTGLCSRLDQRSNTLPRKPNVKSTYWYFHTYLRRHSLLEPWQFSSSILNHQMYFGGVFIHIILLITVLSTKTEFKSIHNIFNYSNNTLINYKLTKFLYLLKKSFIKC